MDDIKEVISDIKNKLTVLINTCDGCRNYPYINLIIADINMLSNIVSNASKIENLDGNNVGQVPESGATVTPKRSDTLGKNPLK